MVAPSCSVTGNGLPTDNISAKNRAYRQNFVNDIRVTWTTPGNSLTAASATAWPRRAATI